MNPLYPVYATIISYIIVLILSFFIPSDCQKLAESKNDWVHIKKVLIYLKGNRNLLKVIVFLVLFSSL
jgi:hypothetical protein